MDLVQTISVLMFLFGVAISVRRDFLHHRKKKVDHSDLIYQTFKEGLKK